MKNTGKRVVVVTGGSGKIGRSICCSLAKPSTDIYFSYYSNENMAKETAKLVAEAGSRVAYKRLDVANFDEVLGFSRFVLKESGRVDVLVNNAGTSIDGLLVRMKEENWDRVVNVNLKGTFNCIKAVSRNMIKQRYGRIINVASVVGLTGNSGQSNYAASKAGVIGLTKTAAMELACRNITVNAIAPGYIATDMTQKLDVNISSRIVRQIPLGRAGCPSDVSNVASFLASEEASYITGQVISVNGGMYM